MGKKKKLEKLMELEYAVCELRIDDSAIEEERHALIDYWRTQCLIARDKLEELRATLAENSKP